MRAEPSSLPDRPIVVVVAEDDWLIRTVVVEALTEAGLTVFEANDARAALSHLDDHGHRVHVLFSDIHMPGGMDGLELAHQVNSRWPKIGLLVASGQARPTEEEMPKGSRFLPKPYEADHAISHVRELAGHRR